LMEVNSGIPGTPKPPRALRGFFWNTLNPLIPGVLGLEPVLLDMMELI